jgi:hypothetical protein
MKEGPKTLLKTMGDFDTLRGRQPVEMPSLGFMALGFLP